MVHRCSCSWTSTAPGSTSWSAPTRAERSRRSARPATPTSSPTASRPRAEVGWQARWYAVAACSMVAVAAAVVRLMWLTTEPMGLHGDEAAYGLEAGRILRTGWIGPYSGIALGLPSAPLYLVAGAVAVLGNTILAVRIAQALCGVLTVVVLFVVAERSFGVL